jgi:hypothetical protein
VTSRQTKAQPFGVARRALLAGLPRRGVAVVDD